MATLITKNSSTASSVPTNAQLVQGELAVNVTDKRLYTENASGTVVELGTNPGSAVTHTAGTAGAPSITTTGDTNTGIFFPAADTVAASVGGTEGLRLTSTGLGVATSTPNSIGGNSNARYFGLAGDGTLSSADGRVILSNPRAYASIVANSTTAGRIYFQLPNASTGTTTEAAFIDSIASGSGGTSGYGIDIRFGPKADNGSANERMRLDQAGNLGLGVTPSAWNSSSKAIQIGSSGAPYFSISQLTTSTSDGYVMWGAYLTGYRTFAYTTTGDAVSAYRQNAGVHAWFTAPSGTTGNAISFTQAMTLDASGNLGVGTTSTSARLNIVGNSSTGYLTVGDGTSTMLMGAGAALSSDSSIPYLRSNNSIGFATGGGTERARITSGGYLLVGTTSAAGDARLVVNNPDNVSGDFGFVTTLGSNCSNTSSYHYIATTGGADKFYLYGNGNVVNTNGSYGTLSDVKLKENIVDATPKLADVMRLQVRNFNLKTEPSHKQIGFVAQEFEQVFPAMVDESPDRDEEGNQLETTTKHIKTSVLVPILVKAIQELNAKVESLTTELNALKGT